MTDYRLYPLIIAIIVLNCASFSEAQSNTTSADNSSTQLRTPIPGEMVETPLGERKRVWSTRGAVETQQPAISHSGSGLQNVNPMTVIVDERGKLDREPGARGKTPRARQGQYDRFDLRN